MGLKDGLPSLEVHASTFSGTSAQFSAGEISAAELADNAASGTKVDATFPVAGTGSPTGYGLSVQTGSSATGAGSTAWVVFGTPFASNPYFVATPHSASDVRITEVIGSRNPGSTFVISHGAASQEFSWIAIGSGRI